MSMADDGAAAIALLQSLGYQIRAPGEYVEDASESESDSGTVLTTQKIRNKFEADSEIDTSPIPTPAISEIGSEDQSEDGDRTPHASPRGSEVGSEIFSDDFSNLKLPASAYAPSDSAPPGRAEDYEALHATVENDIDKLYPKDEVYDWNPPATMKPKKEKRSKAVPEDTRSMSEALHEVVDQLLPIAVETEKAIIEREPGPPLELATNLKRLIAAYSCYIIGVTHWLDRQASPEMQKRGYKIVGGLDGIIDRARVISLFGENALRGEVIDDLQGSIRILDVLEECESEVEIVGAVDSGLKRHRAIKHALAGCLGMLEGSSRYGPVRRAKCEDWSGARNGTA